MTDFSIDPSRMRLADANIVPILIALYVIFGLVSTFVRGLRQSRAAQANREATTSNAPATAAPLTQPQRQPSSPPQGMAAMEEVRAALARRRAAQARAGAVAVAAPVTVTQAPPPVSVALAPTDDLQIATLPPMPAFDAHPAAPPPNLSALWSALPGAGIAVVASAIIGPCAAHRGGGHQPEDW